jgi:hypothetical protein
MVELNFRLPAGREVRVSEQDLFAGAYPIRMMTSVPPACC